jgi:hypothetical protein
MFQDFLKHNSTNLKAEFFIPLFVNQMIKEGRGKCKITSGGSTWFGVTYKEDKEAVSSKIKNLISKGEYPEKLWK